MARISKVIRMEKKNDGEYAVVTIQLDDGSEVGVTIGGEVETYFYKGTGRAFVKRSSEVQSPIDKVPHGAEIYRMVDGWRIILKNASVGYEKHQAYGKTLDEAVNNLLKELESERQSK